ncbi:MAG: hypothetical protein PUP90_31965 [Nostoc sp. S4]|nr:hypothetical protein [Nostoc sp. S4]
MKIILRLIVANFVRHGRRHSPPLDIVAQKAIAIATISQLSKAIACQFKISSGA